ncbi:MAG: FCD domain-containing protein [Actinomycetota bacterium]
MSPPSHEPSRSLALLSLLVPRACGPVSTRIQVAIERSIALGLFPEGLLPSERQLAATLDVSRTALRAALDLVRESGYAERSLVGRAGGVPIGAGRPLTAGEIEQAASRALDEIGELAAVRTFLEPVCARRMASADERTRERQLAPLVESQERLAAAPSPMAHRMTDGEFHYGLAVVSGSDEIIGTLLRARADLLRWRDRLPMQDTVWHSVTEHVAIIDAIRRGDADDAEAATLAHLRSSQELYTLFLQRYVDEPEIVLAEGEAAVSRPTEPRADGPVAPTARSAPTAPTAPTQRTSSS